MPTRRGGTKAMTILMLCAAVFALGACGQKRPLQLPQHAKHPASGAASSATAPASAASASN